MSNASSVLFDKPGRVCLVPRMPQVLDLRPSSPLTASNVERRTQSRSAGTWFMVVALLAGRRRFSTEANWATEANRGRVWDAIYNLLCELPALFPSPPIARTQFRADHLRLRPRRPRCPAPSLFPSFTLTTTYSYSTNTVASRTFPLFSYAVSLSKMPRRPIYPSFSLVIVRHWQYFELPVQPHFLRLGPPTELPAYHPYPRPIADDVGHNVAHERPDDWAMVQSSFFGGSYINEKSNVEDYRPICG